MSDLHMMNLPQIACDFQGLDVEAIRLIELNWPSLRAFIEEHLRPYLPSASIDIWRDRHLLQEPFTALRREITNAESEDPFEIQKGIRRWHEQFLWPLALDLGLRERVEKTVLENCWRRGHFKRQLDGRKLVHRPDEEKEALLAQVRDIFLRFQSRKGERNYIDALIAGEHKICRDKITAETVGREYKRINERAAALAQGAILAFIKHGELGILQHALYPGADELLLLQGYYQEITEQNAQPEAVVTELRADVIALHRILTLVDVEPSLWQQDLLHWPRHSFQRQQYLQRLTPSLIARIVADIAMYRHYDIGQAREMVTLVFQGGLSALIDWRCSPEGQETQPSTEQRRLRRLIERQLAAINSSQRHDIEELVEHLRTAMEETQVVFSIRRLLNDAPYSPKRRRFSKGIWFGVSSIQRRRQRFNRRRRGLAHAPAKVVLIEPDEGGEVVQGFSPEDLLVRRFAELAELTEPEARDVIRNLGIYGGLGVVLKSGWRDAIDDRVVEYIELVRQGRVDGTVQIGALRERVNSYARSLGVPALSRQLVESLFFGLPKQRRWNGGEGSSVAGVRQRATLVIAAPRLHETWIILAFCLRIPLGDNYGRVVSDVCHVLVVLDQATERPVGCWVSANPPGETEVGLAVFQAIWHPWAPNWPIRGIPEKIIVPSTLATAHLADLERGAYFLLATVEVGEAEAQGLLQNRGGFNAVERIESDAVRVIWEEYRHREPTSEEVLKVLIEWFSSEEWFPNHRFQAVPKGWLLSFPGHQSPPAGWLLPGAAQTVQRVEQGIIDRGVLYPGVLLPNENRGELKKREFPLFHHVLSKGFFVQSGDGTTLCYISAED